MSGDNSLVLHRFPHATIGFEISASRAILERRDNRGDRSNMMRRRGEFPARQAVEEIPCRGHAFEAGGDPIAPPRALREGMAIGLGQIVGPIVNENADEERGLGPILARLRLVRTALPSAGHDQLVDREALGARDLHKDAGAVKSQRVNRLRNQEIEVVQRLSAHTQSGKRPDAFVAECRRQEFDHGLAAALTPLPDLPVEHARDRVEFHRLENMPWLLLDPVAQSDREPLETRKIHIPRLGKLVGVDADTKLSLVERVGSGADDRTAKTEHAGTCEGEQQRACLPVRSDHPFGPQDARQTRHARLSLLRLRFQLGRARQAMTQVGAVLPKVAALHLSPDPKPVVEIGSPVAVTLFDAAQNLRGCLVEMHAQQILISDLR